MKKYKVCLIITALSFVPLIVTAIIPYTTCTRLYANNTYYPGRKEEYIPKNYVISLTAGNYYTIKFASLPFTSYAMLRIGDDPYMISGYEITTTTVTIERIIVYYAQRSGDHYIQVFGQSESTHLITIEQGLTDPPNEYLIPFFNGMYLLGFILPTIISAFVGNLIVLLVMRERPSRRKYKVIHPIPIYVRRDAKQAELKKIKFCQTCGTKFRKPFKYCPNCGEQTY